MYNLWPLFLILLAMIIIFSIISKKLPQLAILDVDNLPKEKENRAKEKLIQGRLRRDQADFSHRFLGFLKSFLRRPSFFSFLQKKLQDYKERQSLQKKLAGESPQKRLDILRQKAEYFIKQGRPHNLEQAEKLLIRAAEENSRDVKVFFDLGSLYLEMKKFVEAKQTFVYVLKLLELEPDKKMEAESYFNLAEACQQLRDIDGVLDNILESLKVEGHNPRYLTVLLEAALQKKNLQIAQEAWEKIKEVNPENNKLEYWKEKIGEI